MQVLLEFSWKDPRLSYKEATGLKKITGGKDYLSAIWTPHLFFTNEKDSHVIGRMSKEDFMTLLPSGLVHITTRIKTSMFCLLQLEDFPFDQQKCQISISSWRYNSLMLQLSWDKSTPLQVERLKTSLPEFDILAIQNISSLSDLSQNNKSKNNGAQHFSSLTIRLELRRHYGYYFINYYLPSILLVILSWVAFWLEPAAISTGRVTIGISTMLTFISLCWSAQGVQKVSQNMATDLWAVTCTAFIILSLVESAFVNTIERKGGGEKVQIKKPSGKHIFRGGMDYAAGRAKVRRSSSLPSSPEVRRHFTANKLSQSKTMMGLKDVSLSLGNIASSRVVQETKAKHNVFAMSPQQIAIWIDEKSRIVFPAAFFIFNVIYWLPLFIVKG